VLDLQSQPPIAEHVDLETGEVSVVAEVEGARPWAFAVSPDRRWILFQRIESRSDIMLVENLR